VRRRGLKIGGCNEGVKTYRERKRQDGTKVGGIEYIYTVYCVSSCFGAVGETSCLAWGSRR
jgi:hypothetical protein